MAPPTLLQGPFRPWPLLGQASPAGFFLLLSSDLHCFKNFSSPQYPVPGLWKPPEADLPSAGWTSSPRGAAPRHQLSGVEMLCTPLAPASEAPHTPRCRLCDIFSATCYWEEGVGVLGSCAGPDACHLAASYTQGTCHPHGFWCPQPFKCHGPMTQVAAAASGVGGGAERSWLSVRVPGLWSLSVPAGLRAALPRPEVPRRAVAGPCCLRRLLLLCQRLVAQVALGLWPSCLIPAFAFSLHAPESQVSPCSWGDTCDVTGCDPHSSPG